MLYVDVCRYAVDQRVSITFFLAYVCGLHLYIKLQYQKGATVISLPNFSLGLGFGCRLGTCIGKENTNRLVYCMLVPHFG